MKLTGVGGEEGVLTSGVSGVVALCIVVGRGRGVWASGVAVETTGETGTGATGNSVIEEGEGLGSTSSGWRGEVLASGLSVGRGTGREGISLMGSAV